MDEALLAEKANRAGHDEPPASPLRWLMLLSFSLATACNGLMYASEAAVAVPAENFYGIEEKKVLSLTDIFYVGFIPFVFPAIALITRPNGLRWAVVGGSMFLAAGSGLRCLANQPTTASFFWMEAGTATLSVSTPLLLGCITLVAANWFPEHERGLATSIGVLAAQAGMMVSFILPRKPRPPSEHFIHGAFAESNIALRIDRAAIFVPSVSASSDGDGSDASGSDASGSAAPVASENTRTTHKQIPPLAPTT